MNIGRNDHAAARHLGADRFRRDAFALRDEIHLLGSYTLPGIMHLCSNLVVITLPYPLCAHDGSLSGNCGPRAGAMPRPFSTSASWASSFLSWGSCPYPCEFSLTDEII